MEWNSFHVLNNTLNNYFTSRIQFILDDDTNKNDSMKRNFKRVKLNN